MHLMDTLTYSVYYLIFGIHISIFVSSHLNNVGLISIPGVPQLDILT